MTKGKKLLLTLGIILLVSLTAGLTALATSNYGSSNDPLVALSYLDKTVTPNIMDKLDEMLKTKAQELTKTFNDKVNAASGSSGGTSGGAVDLQTFSVVSLTNGQTLKCNVGTEIMLRIGTAVTAGADSPRLIDETTGADVTAAGTGLTKNHMYMVSINGNGITATSNVKVLVRGEYSIS